MRPLPVIKYLLYFSFLTFVVRTQAQVLTANPNVTSGCANTNIQYEFSYSAGSIWDLSWEIYPPEVGSLSASSYPQTTASVTWYGDGQIIAYYTAYNNDWQEVDQSSLQAYFTKTETHPGTISISGPLTRCYSASGSFSISGNSNTPTWQKCASSTCPTNSDTNWSTTSSSFANLTGTTKFRAKVTTACGTAYSNIITITILPEFTEGSIYVGNGQSFCHSQPIEITSIENSTGGDGPITYQWQVSQGGSFSDVTGASQAEYTIPSNSLSPGYSYSYRRLAKGTSCPASWVASNTVNVTTYGVLQAGALSGGSTICTGTSPPLITESSPPTGGGGNYSYVWHSSDNGTSNWSSTLSTAASYDPGPTISARKYYRRTVTSSCGSSVSEMTYFDVYNTSAGTITGPGHSCYNGSGNLGVSGNSGTVTWQKCTSECSTTDDTGWSTTTGSFSNLTATTKFRAKLNDTSCGVKYSNIIETIVAQQFFQGTINPGGTFCANGTFTISSNQNAAGGQGAISYQWQYNAGSGFVDIGGATQASYTIPSGQIPVNGTYAYRRGAKSTCEPNFLYTASVNVNAISPSIGGTALSVSANEGSNMVYSNTFGATKLVGNTGTVVEWQYSFSNTTGPYQSWGQAGLTTTTQTCCIGSPEQTIWIRAAVQNSTCAVAYSAPASYYWQPTPPVVDAGTDKSIYDTESSVILTGSASGGNGAIASYAWSKISGPQATLSNTSTSALTVSGFVAGSYVFRLSVTDAYNYTSHDDVTLTVAIANNHNYIRESVILVEGISEQNIESLPSTMKSVNTTYYDGLGRPMQIVNWQATPSQQDLVQPIKYDAYGRESVKYLPYASSENNGWYKEDALRDPLENVNGELEEYRTGKQFEFYQTGNTISTDLFPYSETIFENSPLNRIVKQGAPGETWQPNNDDYSFDDHTVKFRYETNNAGEVLLWRYDNATNLISAKPGTEYEYYAPGTLYVHKRYDENDDINENGKLTIEYKDKEGRVILKRVQATANSSTVDHINYASTYYIYDNFGSLVAVLPPEASKAYATYHGYSVTDKEKFLKNLAFRYRYDQRKRMTEKWVPGAGVVYLVYDNRDRLVLTQDGKQRSASPYKWTFTKYDALNRPVITGQKDTTVLLTQSGMQSVVNLFYTKPWTRYGETYVGNVAGTVHGYSNKSYPVATSGSTITINSILTVTYYDDYSFKSIVSGDFDYIDENLTETRNGATYSQPETEFTRVVGQITGTKVLTMDGGYTWLTTVNYYDEKYRLIQSASSNYVGGHDRITNLYDFAGKLLETRKTHYGLNFTDLVNIRHMTNRLSKLVNTATWGSSGAASVEILPANEEGWIEFVAATTDKNMMIGLSESNANAHWNTIKYALFLTSQGKVEVRENGSTNQLLTSPAYKVGDVFRMERTQGNINYYHNGVLLRQVAASSNPLLVDVAIHGAYGIIFNIRSSFGSFYATDVTQRFEYDHAGRLSKNWHQINDGPEILLVSNKYNELSQLVDKRLHSTLTDATDARQSIDYRYNIRGWLTSMNNAALEPNSENNDESNDYFGQELVYDDLSDVGNSPQFNGNISAMKWSKNLSLGPVAEVAYTYSYDALNRISTASYKENDGGWVTPVNAGFSAPQYSYDLNGNLTGLKRYDERGVASPMDNLIYDYGTGTARSNKLLKVSEKTGTDAGDPLKGFRDGSNSGNDYAYDANGNMTIDQNKGITTAITYNYLNLPAKVTRGTGSVTYRYDASGRKLAIETMFGSGVPKHMAYVDEFIYENGALSFIQHPEGRIMMQESPETIYYNGRDNLDGTTGATDQSLVTLNGNETYIEVTNTGSGDRTGINFGTFPTQPGERYVVRAKGYRTGTTPVHFLHRIIINGQIIDQGLLAQLPTGPELESWIEHTFTVPAGGTSFYVALVWHPSATGQKFYVNDYEIIKLGATATDPEYQYHMKDHLGNVRLTFTTKSDVDEFQATMETGHMSVESADFPNYSNVPKSSVTDYNHTDEPNATRSVVLNGAENKQIGLAKSLRVIPGDTIDLEVYAKYFVPGSSGQQVGTLISSAITSAFGLSSTSSGHEFSAFQSLDLMFDAGWVLGPGDWEDANAPKAFLNYILFDEDFVPYDMGWDQIDVNAEVTQSNPNPSHDHLSVQALARKPGYIYIYFSNEDDEIMEVYFDDFTIRHKHSPVVQADDFYPFGLTFNSYQRENSVDQRWKFQGQEHIDDLGLNWDSFKWRNHQPDIGRFFNVDPLADKYVHNSPYAFSENKVTTHIELEGLEGVYIHSEGEIQASLNGQMGEGLVESVTDAATSLWNAVTNPVETAKGLWHAVTNPVETAIAIKDQTVNSFNENPQKALGKTLGNMIMATATAGVANEVKVTTEVAEVPKVLSKVDEAVKIAEGGIPRIQNAANRINKPITVVGSRASGTAKATSDFDYIIPGLKNSDWKKIKNSLPGSANRAEGLPNRIDVFPDPVDPKKPHITVPPTNSN